MEALEVIYSRRSIRTYTGEVIGDESVQKLIKAGFASPSAHNRQPWEFVVVKDANILKQVAEGHPYAKMLPQAGCCIIVCGNNEIQKTTGFLVSDCSAATENILLAAHSLHLGAVWCGVYPHPELMDLIRQITGLPQHIIPVSLIPIGVKAEDKPARDNYSEAKVHYNKW